jgi:hypothetical protein
MLIFVYIHYWKTLIIVNIRYWKTLVVGNVRYWKTLIFRIAGILNFVHRPEF